VDGRPHQGRRGNPGGGHDLHHTGPDESTLAQVEHRSIARLCRSPRSVAEISAELVIPLQVAKIVLGDMVATGLVIVHRTTGLSGGSSHLALMERVLGGLRRL